VMLNIYLFVQVSLLLLVDLHCVCVAFFHVSFVHVMLIAIASFYIDSLL